MKRKLLSLILAIALCVSFVVPAFADYIEEEPIDDLGISWVGLGAEGSSVDIVNGPTCTAVIGFSIMFYDINMDDLTEDDIEGTTITMGGEPLSYEIASITRELAWEYKDTDEPDLVNFTITFVDTFTDQGIYSLKVVYKGAEYNGNYGYHYQITGDDATPPVAKVPSSWAQESITAAVEAGIVPEALQ